MTRKDYELIAKVLNDTRPIALSESGQMQLAQWNATAARLAVELERDNPRFDSSHFLNACGVQ